MKITVREHSRRLPAKPSDPLIEAYSAFVGRELVSDLETRLKDFTPKKRDELEQGW